MPGRRLCNDFLGLLLLLLAGMVLYWRLTGVEECSSPSDNDPNASLFLFLPLTGLTSSSAPGVASCSGGVSECGVPCGDCMLSVVFVENQKT